MNEMVSTAENHLPSADAIEALGRNGHALQQMRTSYATAVSVQKPRQLADVQRRFLDEARLAGEDFYYGWGSGKDAIEGASVKLAMSLARCWGNCAIEAMPVQDMFDSWVFTAAFVDLETGFTLTRQFRQSKQWMVYGKFDPQRKDDIRFQIGQSKAARNVILNALPQWMIDRAMTEAKAGVRAKIEEYVKQHGHAAAVDLVLRALLKAGVKEELILKKCMVAKREAIDLDHLVLLRGDLSAIEAGQERAETLFPAEVATGESSKGKQDALADKLAARGKAPDDRFTVPGRDKSIKQPETPENDPEPVPEATQPTKEQMAKQDAEERIADLVKAAKVPMDFDEIDEEIKAFGQTFGAEWQKDQAAKAIDALQAMSKTAQPPTPKRHKELAKK
jgi:hypothetical protein